MRAREQRKEGRAGGSSGTIGMDTNRNFGAECGLLFPVSFSRHWEDMVEAVGFHCRPWGSLRGAGG